MAKVSFRYACAFCVCLAVFIGTTAFAVHEAISTLAGLRKIKQGQHVAEDVITRLDEAVASERGYMLTGNSSFLLSYQRAKARLPHAVDAVARLLPASPDGDAESRRLKSAVAVKVAVMDRAIALCQQGNLRAATALVVSPGNLTLMPQIHAQLSRRQAAVTLNMRSVVNRAIAALRFAIVSRIIGGIAILLLLASTVRRVIRSSARERAAFEALSASEEHLKATLLSIGDGVIATDEDGLVTIMNPAAEKMTGWSLNDARARDCTDVLTLLDSKHNLPAEALETHIRLQRVTVGVSDHKFLRRRTGEETPIEAGGAPISGVDGNSIGVILCLRDVTDRRIAETQLRNSEERYRLMFDSNPTPMWLFDRRTRAYLDVNGAAIKQYGYTREEFLAMTADQIRPVEEVARLVEYMKVVPTGASNAGIWHHMRKDGSVFPVEIWGDQLSIEGRKVRLALAIDRTEIVQVQTDLKALNATLEQRVNERTAAQEETNVELQAFTDAAAHDLKAPARWVEGYSRAILEDFGENMEADMRAKIERIQWSGHRMTQFVDGLYSLTRVSHLEMRRSAVDVGMIARSILAELHDAEPTRQATITVVNELTVWADEALITIVLSNLLSNAWKFTRNTVPTVISVERADDEDGLEVFVVRDNGAGFDQASAEKAFGLFQRLHSRDEFEGTGVGLATAQRIISRHGGRIRGEGRVNEGAAFFVALPREV